MELDRLERSHGDAAELTRLDHDDFKEAHCLENGTEARVAPGRLCGDARYFVVRCARPGRLRATQQMPFAAFQELRRQLGEQAALVKSPFPCAPPSPARRLAAKFFRAAPVDAAAADRARARALEAWLGEVVQLAAWGTLRARACWAVRDALLYDECAVVEPSPAKATSGRMSPVPAAPVTPPAVPSPPKSPPRELLEDQPPRPPGDDKNELDFDDCGRDPGPCAIARALSQLQSSVAPRRMVMV